jgi:hypothetical protein
VVEMMNFKWKGYKVVYFGVVVGDVEDRQGWRKGMEVKFRAGKRKKQKHL